MRCRRMPNSLIDRNDQEDRELFPLSYITQYGYCPRRCFLLALEQEWNENEYTAQGRSDHARVHNARLERKGEDLYLYELSVFSRSLGVNGKCDCLEAHVDPSGVSLPYGIGKYSLFPIEYKHGKLREEEEYEMQLCAQAMCLEEMFSCRIEVGAVFYIDAHRRKEVRLDDILRKKTQETAKQVAELIAKEQVVMPHYSAKCKKCSMNDLCRPKLKYSAMEYCSSLWDIAEGKEGI